MVIIMLIAVHIITLQHRIVLVVESVGLLLDLGRIGLKLRAVDLLIG